jgi:hypothetical protein
VTRDLFRVGDDVRCLGGRRRTTRLHYSLPTCCWRMAERLRCGPTPPLTSWAPTNG